MIETSKKRFVPKTVLGIAVIIWLCLMGFALRDILHEPLPVPVVFLLLGFPMLGCVMGLVTLWLTILIVLIFNVVFKDRRSMFRRRLWDWSWLFAVLTLMGIVSMMLPDSD